jgi:hypothetical protein
MEVTKMDKFTKVLFVGALIGSVFCAGLNGARDRVEAFGKEETKLTEDGQQYRVDAEALDKDYPEFVFGNAWNHLEKEKEYIAWVADDGRYIAENYYLGDHYSDPRLVVVRSEDTGDVVQVFTTSSYEKRSQIAMALDEVPD